MQFGLIGSHVTLCHEEEIENLQVVMRNLEHIKTPTITINFGQVSRFENGKGLLIPSSGDNREFHELRAEVLSGLASVKLHEPHITLIHPRNSACTDNIFESIKRVNLPVTLRFDRISLIEQADGSPWDILKTFSLKEI